MLAPVHIPGLALRGTIDDLPWRTTRVEGVDWIDLAPGGARGVSGGAMTVLIRMAPGVGYPRHRHLGPEDVLVLAGGYVDDDGRRADAGDCLRYEAGSAHAPTALGDPEQPTSPDNPACILYAVAHGGTEVLGGDDGGRA